MGASFLNTTPHGRHNTLDVYCIIVHCTSSLHIVICNRYFCRIARIFFVCQKSMFHLMLLSGSFWKFFVQVPRPKNQKIDLFFIKMGVAPEQKIFKKIQIRALARAPENNSSTQQLAQSRETKHIYNVFFTACKSSKQKKSYSRNSETGQGTTR